MTSGETTPQQHHEYMIMQRGIRGTICPRCSGTGTVLYGSTAIWRGGIGGRAMTTGPCNKCWGSGEKDRPWPSHREFEQMQKQLAKK